MPRLITWLPRLHEIRRSVANSVRSHYDRRDIEALFELQPRAAQNLLRCCPVRIGTSHLIERDVRGGEIHGTSPSVPAGNFTPASRYTHPVRYARKMPT